jgi:hypothetical protein
VDWRNLLGVIVCLLAAAAPPAARATQPGRDAGSAETYRKALHGRINLVLAKAQGRGNPTVELAAAAICKGVGIPYQLERSRTLTKGRTATRIPPVNWIDVVAGKALVTIASKAGLAMRIDGKGVYLVPRPESTDTTPRKLTTTQRLQVGAALNVVAKVLRGKQISDKYYADQYFQLTIELKTTRAFKDLKVVVQMYARIDRSYLRSSSYDDDKRPRYGPRGEFVEIHKATLAVAELPPAQARELRSKVINTWQGPGGYYPYRYSEKYYGYVVDFFVNEQMVKSIVAPRKLHELIGRDQHTGFPPE